VISAAKAEPIAKVAIAAAATDLMNVRLVFMKFLKGLKGEQTLTRLYDEYVTNMTV
jgi:hypothetical protein